MGQIVQVHCAQCGFEKKLYVGGGLADCEMETIMAALPEREQRVLDAAIREGASQISITRKLCVCSSCKAVYALPVVSCTLRGQQGELYGVCPQCGEPGNEEWEEDEALPCPVCRNGLTQRQTGHWD